MKIVLILTWLTSPGVTPQTAHRHFDSMEDCQIVGALTSAMIIMERGGNVEYECVEA